jgi:3-hydroxyacyl-CoA dehydrogenase
MREAGGFRMGPFELMDMIGHDVNFAVTNRCGAPSTTTRASCPR